MDLVKYLLEHWLEILAVGYGLVNVANGVLDLIPGEQAKAVGVLGTIRSWMDRISLLTSKDGKATFKAPGFKSKTGGDK